MWMYHQAGVRLPPASLERADQGRGRCGLTLASTVGLGLSSLRLWSPMTSSATWILLAVPCCPHADLASSFVGTCFTCLVSPLL